VPHMRIRLSLDRWYVGLHGLALLRSYPFGDPKEAQARMAAMRSLLAKEGDASLFEAADVEVFAAGDAYELWSERYDEPNPMIVAEEHALLAALSRVSPGRALDVATGTGRVAFHLAQLGHEVFACDRSQAMLHRAQIKLRDVRLLCADLTRLPIADESVDLVTCSLALTHVDHLLDAMRSFTRVVRPGGAVVLSDVHPFAVATGAHAFFRLRDDSRAVTRNEEHAISDYITAAHNAGFEIETCSEAIVDNALLRKFGVPEGLLQPENALLGLPFAIVWVLRRRRTRS
jgi:ubiquinone/menaquinone biosynthesis C-methylase UbiE